MPAGDEDGLDARAGAQHRADDFAFVGERHPVAPAIARLVVTPDQAFLRHPDARQIRQHAQMTGDTEPSRVRQPLAVADEHVGK